MLRITLVLIWLTLSLSANAAVASIIGTETLFEYRFGDEIIASQSVTTVEGPGDTVNMLIHTNGDGATGYNVDLDSDTLVIDFYYPNLCCDVSFSDASINSLVISNEHLNIDEFIATAQIVDQQFGFQLDRIFQYEDSVALDFRGLSFGDSSYLEISFVQTVPIPAAAWLFGSALLGLGVTKRRRA